MKEKIIERISESIAAKELLKQKAGDIEKAASMIIDAYKNKKRLYTCGNGGSTCDAMHFAEELVARFKMERPGLPAQSLSDSSTITCWANDYDFSTVFSRQIEAYGAEGDILIAISTSGNSENILKAAEAAKNKGMKVIGLSGKDGGKLNDACDLNLVVPSNETARIQESHITIIHILCELVESGLFGGSQ